jgi:hypothetical protein
LGRKLDSLEKSWPGILRRLGLVGMDAIDLARYLRRVCALLTQAGLSLSLRRAVMLLANITAVHAARLTVDASSRFADSALLPLTHSLPQRATGEVVFTTKIMTAHKEAWRATQLEEMSPLPAILAESDPLRRCVAAIQIQKLRRVDFSSVVADCLASLPAGGRHALAGRCHSIPLFQRNQGYFGNSKAICNRMPHGEPPEGWATFP